MEKADVIFEVLSVRDQVANIIRKRIMHGEYKEGEQISERAISEQLCISTTPVKEAFRMLYTEGLLTSIPRKGTFVSDFSIQTILQITYIRSVLEGIAAFFATENLTEKEILDMENALAVSLEAIKKDDIEALTQSNALFHRIIRNGSHNSYLIRILESFRSLDYSIRVTSLVIDGENKIAHSEHNEIKEAIKKRDKKLTESLMVKHIRRVANYTLDIPHK